MKYFKSLILVAGLTAITGQAQTADFAPANLSSVILNGTIARFFRFSNGWFSV